MENRKKWIQPQLIVLGRGTPEENVLAGCKTSVSGSNTKTTYKTCYKSASSKKVTYCDTSKCSTISKTS